jgi:hypothetical protein
MSWFPGVPSYLHPDLALEAPVAEDVHTDDSPRLTETTFVVIDHDKPRSLRSEDDLPMSPKSSAASSEGGSRRPRPNIKVYTKLKPNIAQKTTATRGPPGGGSDSGRHEASSNPNKANVPQAPLHRRVITLSSQSHSNSNDIGISADTARRAGLYRQTRPFLPNMVVYLARSSKHTKRHRNVQSWA